MSTKAQIEGRGASVHNREGRKHAGNGSGADLERFELTYIATGKLQESLLLGSSSTPTSPKT